MMRERPHNHAEGGIREAIGVADPSQRYARICRALKPARSANVVTAFIEGDREGGAVVDEPPAAVRAEALRRIAGSLDPR